MTIISVTSWKYTKIFNLKHFISFHEVIEIRRIYLSFLKLFEKKLSEIDSGNQKQIFVLKI